MKTLIAIVLTFIFSFSAVQATDLQDKRRAFIEKSISQGYFHKVEMPGKYPEVHVKPLFMTLSYDDKVMLVNVVYSYFVTADSRSNIVTLVDYRNNKSVGQYTLATGLSME